MKISSNIYNETAKANELSQVANKKILESDLNSSISISATVNNFPLVSELTDENGQPTKRAIQTAVNKINEFLEYNQHNSKFIYHEELDKYYVEVVDARTQEVVKEIPPKELLDAYYEMQKLAGKIFDTQA